MSGNPTKQGSLEHLLQPASFEQATEWRHERPVVWMEGEPGRVACYSGSRYGERPASFKWGGSERRVKAIESEWIEPGARHFRLRTEDDRLFELCYYEDADQWLIEERAADRREGGCDEQGGP